jgi:hypothetical protein
MLYNKNVNLQVTEKKADGGRIIISTGEVDRDKDRVFPQGAKIENYMRSPVVLFGHNYFDPWSLIGQTNSLEVNETGIVAEFSFREPANEADPMHIIRSLWDQGILKAASIGFRPETMVPNDFGGLDFVSWELLEFSLVHVPANQSALRLAAKDHPKALQSYTKAIEEHQKRGARHSAKDQERIQAVHDHAVDLGADCVTEEDGEEGDGERALQGTITGLLAETERLKAQIAALEKSRDDEADERALLAWLNDMQIAVRR